MKENKDFCRLLLLANSRALFSRNVHGPIPCLERKVTEKISNLGRLAVDGRGLATHFLKPSQQGLDLRFSREG